MSEFWELTIRFFSLGDANVRYVLLGSVFLGGAAGGLGSFAFLQRRSLLGDALAHAALPGVGIAFLLTGQKNLFLLLLGAIISCWLGSLAINYIITKTKLKLDTALSIILSVFFGLGIVILTHIQQSGSGAQSGLDKFLFGQAAAMTYSDVLMLAIVGSVMLLLIVVWFSKFKLITFDPGFAMSIGLKVNWLQFLLTTMIVVSVTIGLQAVGVVLMAALLFTPAAAARQWTDNLKLMITLASVFGAVAGIFGAYISFLAPKFPTGPWIIIVISFIFLFSLFFSPKRGLVSRMRTHFENRKKMTREHILKVLYKQGHQRNDWSMPFSNEQILAMWSFTAHELKTGLRQLVARQMLHHTNNQHQLTDAGIIEGARIIRLHRLWEVYLAKYLELPEDHLHRDAEEMEHIITPEIEKRLLTILDNPQVDPHNQEIPYPIEQDKK